MGVNRETAILAFAMKTDLRIGAEGCTVVLTIPPGNPCDFPCFKKTLKGCMTNEQTSFAPPISVMTMLQNVSQYFSKLSIRKAIEAFG
jgi:hypothetical protein